MFARLLALTDEPDGDESERPRLVSLSPGRKAAWVRFYNEHAREHADLTGGEAAAWAKLEGYAARLALVVHLTRWAASDDTLANPALIDAESIAAGAALVRWFAGEARRVYAVLSESDDDRETRRLVELIQRKGGSVSGRELVQSSRRYRTVDDAEAALSALEDADAGWWETPHQHRRGAPKARRFVLSPVYGVTVYKNRPGGVGSGVSVDADSVDTPQSADDGREVV